MLNISFINSCYGNWQIFINHLKRPPLPLEFAAAALEHGVFLLTRFPNPGMLPGSWVCRVQHSQVGQPAIASSFPGCLLQKTLQSLSFFKLPLLEIYLSESEQKAKEELKFGLPLVAVASSPRCGVCCAVQPCWAELPGLVLWEAGAAGWPGQSHCRALPCFA